MGASHSTKLYDPLILTQNSIKNKRSIQSSTTVDGYSCYFYYDGCNCDQFYSNPSSPIIQEEENIVLKQKKKSSLKRIKDINKPSSKRVHFGGGNKKYTISPQKEDQPTIMNSPFRGLRRTNSGNSNSYPYPRTHTTVMVIPTNNRVNSGGSSRNGEWSSTSSIADESPTSSLSAINFDVSNIGPSYGFDKRRPPLNRAIPPIPESKSNESIMSQASKSLAGTPCEPKPPTLELVQEVVEDKSVVIENKMAQNLAAKIATNIPPPPSLQNHNSSILPPSTTVVTTATIMKSTVVSSNTKLKQPKEIIKQSKNVQTHSDPPKSPLLSMAHSVRNRLNKFGSRFTRSDSHSRSPIRSSTSLISMTKPSQIPTTKMAKSSSMEATRNIPSTSMISAKTSISNIDEETTTNSHAPMLRSQITLIPSPCRSPRSFVPAELPQKTTKTFEEKINLPSTIQEESTVTSSAEPSPLKKQTKTITSPVSAATTTSSNTDTIYSGRVSSSTRPITSPDWSEASNAKTNAPSVTTTTAAAVEANLESPEKDKSAVENIPPSMPKTIIEEKINLKKNSKELGKTKSSSPSTPKSQKSEKASKTPKLAAKFGFGGNKSSKTQKVLPSPKIKVKKGSLILKEDSEKERRTEEIVKIPPRKSLSFEAQQPKPLEIRRNSEMKFIKRIEKSLLPNSMQHNKIDNNHYHSKNMDMRNMNVRSVNMKNRRAPLAEFESTRVENSPAVELPPIGFDRLTSSPGQRRRAQTAAAARIPSTTTSTTTIMHDSNGNVISSSSIDVLTAAAAAANNLSDFGIKEKSFFKENKTATTTFQQLDNRGTKISHDADVEVMTKDNSYDKTYSKNGKEDNVKNNINLDIQRMETSADSIDEPKASTKSEMPMTSSYTSHASTSDSKISSDQNANSTKNYSQPQISREDFNDLKSKLYGLKNMLEDQDADDKDIIGSGNEQSFKELSHENQLLRKELIERDRIIETLRKQLAASANVKS